MSKFPVALAVAAFICAGSTAMANENAVHGKDKEKMMKEMDTNNDSKISRDEYMRYHEKKWQSMDKTGSGVVDMKDMQRMHDQHKHDSSTKTKDKPSTNY